MNNYVVYKHTSPEGKVYIGSTCQAPTRRWHGGSAYKGFARFHADIEKYGWSAFQHDILAEGLTREEACQMEVELIAQHQSTDPAKGYNTSLGGDKTTLGYRYSAESRARISQALKGKRKGIPHTEEHRKRISEALRGRKDTPAQLDAKRKAMGDRFSTTEARAKQKANTPKDEKHHKATAVLCVDTGELYPTIKAAALAGGVHRSDVSACCRGLQQTAGGKRWCYAKED